MIKVGIVGAAGYAGSELLRLLDSHPLAEVTYISGRDREGTSYSEIYPNFDGRDLSFKEENWGLMSQLDVVFLAVPHGVAAQKVTRQILDNTKIVDFGADFRFKNVNTYEQWYGVAHNGKEFLKEAVYGLPEIYRNDIKEAKLLANPGCYTTCSILALYPLVKFGLIDVNSIIIDAASGVTGAGRGVSQDMLFCEVNENFKAYKVASHRHTPEIEEQLSNAAGKEIVLNFTPHLAPMNRGILATSYANLKDGVKYNDISDCYKETYGKEYFVRLLEKGKFPETRWVKGSNFIDIGFAVDERTNRVIVVSALDNLVKGAAGQAVQNMNLMFDFDEKTGLDFIPPFPI